MEGNVVEQNEEGQNHRRMERYVEDMSLESSYYRIKYDLYFQWLFLFPF